MVSAERNVDDFETTNKVSTCFPMTPCWFSCCFLFVLFMLLVGWLWIFFMLPVCVFLFYSLLDFCMFLNGFLSVSCWIALCFLLGFFLLLAGFIYVSCWASFWILLGFLLFFPVGFVSGGNSTPKLHTLDSNKTDIFSTTSMPVSTWSLKSSIRHDVPVQTSLQLFWLPPPQNR